MTEYILFEGKTFCPEVVMPPDDFAYFWHNEDRNCNIFDWQVRDCAGGGDGCPAVMLINSTPDTIFDRQWQYYLYAINPGMRPNNISNLMGRAAALMNNTGVGTDRADYIMGENLNGENPRLDKFRTFSRNTHMAKREGERWRLVTLDGNNPPPIKPGCDYPRTLADADMSIYVYTPQTHPHLFLVCNNVQTKPGSVTSVFPFANGAFYPWTPEREPYSFFPFVSKFPQYIDPDNWTQLEPGQYVNPYRRVG